MPSQRRFMVNVNTILDIFFSPSIDGLGLPNTGRFKDAWVTGYKKIKLRPKPIESCNHLAVNNLWKAFLLCRYAIMAPNVFHIGVTEQVSIAVFDAGNPVNVKLYLQDYPHRRKTFSQVQGRVDQGNILISCISWLSCNLERESRRGSRMNTDRFPKRISRA